MATKSNIEVKDPRDTPDAFDVHVMVEGTESSLEVKTINQAVCIALQLKDLLPDDLVCIHIM